ncbi:MAG TPA: AAA family ATPase [Iamia sp.]|nr:AAA family ATPase [Iamia sp.]
MVTPVRPRLIAVCGVPGAGKTTLARGLGVTLHLPVLVRDDLKTGIAHTWSTADWADPAVRSTLGGKAFADFHALLHAYLDTTSALVAEAAWHWSLAREEILPVFHRSLTTLVHVEVDPALAAARYRSRYESGARHTSHVDGAFADQMDDAGYDWRRYLPPPDLPVRQVTVDGSLPPDRVLAATLAALAPPP